MLQLELNSIRTQARPKHTQQKLEKKTTTLYVNVKRPQILSGIRIGLNQNFLI